MNTAQRKFLIERIQQKVKERINTLKNSLLKSPSASNYVFRAILNGQLEIQSKELILDALRKKALNAKEGENWLSKERNLWNVEGQVQLNIEDLIVLPEEYLTERVRVEAHNKAIESEIELLKMQLETTEVRVQLASDKTLQKLINEVDDMGSLSLIDTKLKLLS